MGVNNYRGHENVFRGLDVFMRYHIYAFAAQKLQSSSVLLYQKTNFVRKSSNYQVSNRSPYFVYPHRVNDFHE